jgi:hypothetical protein
VASAYDSPYFTASAKTGENVENVFAALAEKIIKRLEEKDELFLN